MLAQFTMLLSIIIFENMVEVYQMLGLIQILKSEFLIKFGLFNRIENLSTNLNFSTCKTGSQLASYQASTAS